MDDDAALDAAEENKMSVETRQLAVEEEKRLQEETERAQLEQQRLAELQQIEFEVRRQKDEERRKRAQDPNRVTFILLNVVIVHPISLLGIDKALTQSPEHKGHQSGRLRGR